jgi:PleD family two-component response regulator
MAGCPHDTGMAATGSHDNPLERPVLTAGAAELHARLREEIERAQRQGTALSALHVGVDPDRVGDEPSGEVSEQAISYIAAALTRQLRRFDRVGRLSDRELLVLLPGADGPRAEIVARRALARLQAVKVEVDGQRHPIAVAIGLGTWSAGLGPTQLLDRARLLSRREQIPDMPPA